MTGLNYNAAVSAQLPVTAPPHGLSEPSPGRDPTGSGNHEVLRETFKQFVGEAFFGQMIKAMRSTVGKPAYFHGGRAEEVFQGQLDQKLAEHLTDGSAARFAEPMFERQFPHLSEPTRPVDLNQLTQLRRT